MTRAYRVTDSELNAYVDGELDVAATAEIEAWRSADPNNAARLAALCADKAALHDLYDEVLDEAVPAALQNVLNRPRVHPPAPTWLRIAAGVVVLLVGGAGGWGLRDWQAAEATVVATTATPVVQNGVREDYQAFAKRAIGAHVVYSAEVLHPVEVGIAKEAHLLGWLSKRLGTPVRVPDLAKRGFAVIGGRLLADQGKPAAQFMYEDQAGRRVTIYVRADQGQKTAFRLVGGTGASAFYWVDAPLAYALAGDLARDELLAISLDVYNALSL